MERRYVVINAAAATDELALVASADGWLLAIDPAGEVQSRWRAPAAVVSAPAVADEMTYVVAQDGTLTGLTLPGLEPVWSVRLGPAGMYISSPVVSSGRLFVGTKAGMQCVGRRTERTD